MQLETAFIFPRQLQTGASRRMHKLREPQAVALHTECLVAQLTVALELVIHFMVFIALEMADIRERGHRFPTKKLKTIYSQCRQLWKI